MTGPRVAYFERTIACSAAATKLFPSLGRDFSSLLAAEQEWFRLPCPCCECLAITKQLQKSMAGDGPKLTM
jgi:hypothetical protein